MSVQIRTAVAADRTRCLDLLTSLSQATGGSMHANSGVVFDSLLDGSRGQVLVAEEDDRQLGLASLSFNLAMRYGGEYCQLEELVVDPDARGKNIGGLLMTECVRVAKQRGCADFGLYLVESTEHNRVFYEKYGFIYVGSELRQRLDEDL